MSNKKSFLRGAAILGVAGIIVKILGAVYRIPLGNILQPEGMGYYQASYPIYTMLFALSTAGLPVAVAKIIAEKRALGDYKSADRVFKLSFIGLCAMGLITGIIILAFGKQIVGWLGTPRAYYSLIALFPALLFVPMMAAFRGYFQGQQNMVPTALSQIFEQTFRIILGLYLAKAFIGIGLDKAAGGAAFGASAGAVAGFLVIFFIYLYNRGALRAEIKAQTFESNESTGELIKKIILIALPITLGAMIVPIMNTFDLKIVMGRLASIGYSYDDANEMWGKMSGYAQTFINFPQVISIGLAMSLVPAISEAFAVKDHEKMKNLTNTGIRTIVLIGMPSTIGLAVLATPIIDLLYFKLEVGVRQSIGSILAALAISVIFLTLVQALTAILQGIGKATIPVINLIIGAGVKIVISYILVGNPAFHIYGAVISTIVAYVIAAVLNFIAVVKYTGVTIDYVSAFIKPTIASFIMGAVAWGVNFGLGKVISPKLSTIVAIGLAAGVYGILIFALKIITKEELLTMPKGKKIVRLLEKFRLC